MMKKENEEMRKNLEYLYKGGDPNRLNRNEVHRMLGSTPKSKAGKT